MKKLLMLRSATLLGVALLGGCKNTDPTTGMTQVSGQVVTFKTNKAVPNPWVQVYHQSRMGGYAAVGQPYQGDAQGRFSLDERGCKAAVGCYLVHVELFRPGGERREYRKTVVVGAWL